MTPSPAFARKSIPRGAALATVLLTALLLVGTAMSPWPSAVGVVFGAILPVVLAILHGPRVSLTFALLNPVAVVLGVLATSHPAAITLLMALATAGIAFAASRGLRSPAVYLALEAGLRGVGSVPPLPSGDASLTAKAFLCAGIALGTGLFLVGLHLWLLPELSPLHRTCLDRRQSALYGLLLGVLLLPATWLVATYWPGSRAGWILVTVLVTVRPAAIDTRRLVAQRVVGTLVGGVLVVIFALTLPADARVAVGAMCAIAAVALRILRVQYGAFVAALTLAVVLLTAPGDETLTADAERVGYTVVAAAVVFVVSMAGLGLLRIVAARDRRVSSVPPR